jgi:hypothetical protein
MLSFVLPEEKDWRAVGFFTFSRTHRLFLGVYRTLERLTRL